MDFKLSLLLTAALFGLVAGNCNPRDYGHGTPVCVCSEELKCEGDFKTPVKVDKGAITAYESSQSGDRFAPITGLQYSKEELKDLKIDAHVTVDATKKHQKIIGFGGAFTDSTGYNIAQLPKDLQSTLVKDYFGPDGIGYRVGRIPIGGTDFSTRAYSLDDNENDDTLEKFALQKEDLEWKIPYIKMAQELTSNQIKLFGSAWSSPTWMKTNHEFNHGGFLIGEPGTKYYKLFAKYLTLWLQEYTKQKVPGLWGLTVVNEPEFGYSPDYRFNVLGMNATIQRDFVKLDLGPALAAAGFGPDKIKLMVLDDNINKMAEFVKAILEDKDAAKFVSGVAFHWYSNGPDGQNAVLDSVAPAHPDMFFLSTEACTLKPVVLGSWERAEDYTQDIIHDLNHHVGGWVEWNMVLDHQGGPSWVKNNFDGAMAVNATAGEYFKQPTYYALGHFSKFVLPDSDRIEFNVTHTPVTDKNLLVTVLERPDQVKVAVVLNRNTHPVKVQFHDATNGYFVVNVKAHAVETVLWN